MEQSQRQETAAPPPPAMFAKMSQDAVMANAPNAEPSATGAAVTQRFIAMRHSFRLETPDEASLPQAWQRIADFCQAQPCEMLSASLQQKTEDSEPFAAQSLRLAPTSLPLLQKQLEELGKIVNHQSDSEDKTAEVVDTEARLHNLSELRNRLRQMLTTARGSTKEMVELERELARVQTELDSATTLRKQLANQTEKVAVDINYQVRRSVVSTGAFAPFWDACRNAGFTLAQSLASLLNFVISTLPWLMILIPSFFGLRKAKRWWQGRKTEA